MAFISLRNLLDSEDRFGHHVTDGEVEDWGQFIEHHEQADTTAPPTHSHQHVLSDGELMHMIYAPLPTLTQGAVFFADWRTLLEPYSALPFDISNAPGGSYWSFDDMHTAGNQALKKKLDEIAKNGAAMCRKMFGQPLAEDKERDVMQWVASTTKLVVKLRDKQRSQLNATHPLLMWLLEKMLLLTDCMYLFVRGEKAYYGAAPTMQGDDPQLHQRFAATGERSTWQIPQDQVITARRLVSFLSKRELDPGVGAGLMPGVR